MNRNNFIVYDFETDGLDANTCEPVQIAAAAVDGRKLEILDTFDSMMQPTAINDDRIYG